MHNPNMTRHQITAGVLLFLAAACAHGDGLKPIRNAIMQSDGNMAGYSWTNGGFTGNLAGSTNYTELDPVYATGGVTRVGLTVAGNTTSTWDGATQTLTIYGGAAAGDGGATNITGGSYDAPSRTLTYPGLTNVAAAVGSGAITQLQVSAGQIVPYMGVPAWGTNWFAARKDLNQSVSASVATLITATNELYDPCGYYETNGNITIPTGVYGVAVDVSVSANTSGPGFFVGNRYLYLNGAQVAIIGGATTQCRNSGAVNYSHGSSGAFQNTSATNIYQIYGVVGGTSATSPTFEGAAGGAGCSGLITVWRIGDLP